MIFLVTFPLAIADVHFERSASHISISDEPLSYTISDLDITVETSADEVLQAIGALTPMKVSPKFPSSSTDLRAEILDRRAEILDLRTEIQEQRSVILDLRAKLQELAKIQEPAGATIGSLITLDEARENAKMAFTNPTQNQTKTPQ